MKPAPTPDRGGDIVHPSALPFILIHAGCAAVFWSGINWPAAGLAVGLYWLRMFGVTAGYHRYFSHRAYVTSRPFQFLLALLAQSSGQKSVLWWAAKHRHHHLYSDMAEDLHSPRQGGVLHSHVGWIFDRRNDAIDLARVADIGSYSELRWLHRYEALPPVALAALCFLIAGWPGLVVGFCWSTALLYHGTFSINSLAHLRGRRRYLTGDDSRNNAVLAVITMGEGWHNNHHAYQSSARQGFRWWEVDATYWLLRLLACAGVVRDLKHPPEAVLRNQRLPSARAVHRAAMHIAAHFKPDHVAAMIRASLQPVDLSALAETVAQARAQATEALAGLHLPHLPARADFAREAQQLAAAASAVDEVVERARELFWLAVAEHLAGTHQARV